MTLSQAATSLRVRPADLMTAVKLGEVRFQHRKGRLWFSRGELFQCMQNPRADWTLGQQPDGGVL